MLPEGVRALQGICGVALPPGAVLSDYRLCPTLGLAFFKKIFYLLKTLDKGLQWEDALTNADSWVWLYK